MEEVRSYWQVASIHHFCTLFQKPFKLPSFEPEELEQAFIIDVPESSRSISLAFNSINSEDNHNKQECEANEVSNDHDKKLSDDEDGDDDDCAGLDDHNGTSSKRLSPDYIPPIDIKPPPQVEQQPQQNEDQHLHLLVKLAIALLKPHFNSKISPTNWENYLIRLIDLNWVGLEQCPSPFSIPIISSDGIELPKSLSFRELPLSDKIDVFTALCDYRLWCEDASELIKDYPLEELRQESIGKDTQGYEYWYFSGTRLFKEKIELSQDLVRRKTRMKELEYKLIELDKARILKEREDKRRIELDRARQLATEAREAKLAAKRQQEREASTSTPTSSAHKRKRDSSTPVQPTRTGLRERRSTATANNTGEETPSRTLRSRIKPAEIQIEGTSSQSVQKSTRSSKNAKQSATKDRSQASTPDIPKKSPEEACREEMEKTAITLEERQEAWSVACESLEEWESFAKRFEKTKSTNEKSLASHIANVLLPHIQGIYAKRAAEIRRKEKELMLSLTARRTSTRITTKRAQEEEEERQAQIREAEIQRKKAEAETRLRAELEREMRAKQNRFTINGGTSTACSEDGDESTGRYNLRQNHHEPPNDGSQFDGIIHPDKLAEFYEALELIVDSVRTTKHAWPFVKPVDRNEPGYYDLIEQPIDLKIIRTKVEFRQYKSLLEIEKDFQLLVNNCEKFNGPKASFTKLAHRLWKSFRKNVLLYLERDLHMNEYETFLYPPDPPIQLQPSNSVAQPDMAPQSCNGVAKQEDQTMDVCVTSQLPEPTLDAVRPVTSNGVSVENHLEGPTIESINPKSATSAHDKLVPENPFKLGVPPNILNSDSHDPMQIEVKSDLNLQFQPTPIEAPLEIIEESEFPPEPVCEEVIMEPCVGTGIDLDLATNLPATTTSEEPNH